MSAITAGFALLVQVSAAVRVWVWAPGRLIAFATDPSAHAFHALP